MNIFDAISSLVSYGLENDFFEKQDKIYYINIRSGIYIRMVNY